MSEKSLAINRYFLSLKWKAALFLAPIILLSEFILIQAQYTDLNQRFQEQKNKIQRNRRQHVDNLIESTNQNLIDVASELYDSSQLDENAQNPYLGLQSSIANNWEKSINKDVISSIVMVDTRGSISPIVGEIKSAPIAKWANMVMTKETPMNAILCKLSCSFFSAIPILMNEKVGGVLIISRSLVDFIIDFNVSTGDDLGILNINPSKSKRSHSNYIENWNASLNALTNKNRLFPIIDDLSKSVGIKNLSTEGVILEQDENAYSIFAVPIANADRNNQVYLLIVSDVSSDFQYIKINIQKMIIWTIVSTIFVLFVLLVFLWKPITYLQRQAATLPLLAKSEFDNFRHSIHYKRYKIDPFTDEVDILDSISIELSHQLENLENEIKARAHELEQFGLHDTLTGLPNRRHFVARLKHALLLAKRNKSKLAVMFLDVDHFKRINDSLGHESGDALLVEVSRRLEKCIRKSDTIARLGGDEFTIIITDLLKDVDASLIAKSITDSVRAPIKIGRHDICVTCSIGIAVAPDNGEDAESLLRYADLAMYKSKGLGRDNYHFYTPSMHLAAQSRMDLENELRTALDRSQFLLHLQVQVDLMSNGISGFESLLRWKHPERGLVSPDQFIPILEDTGLIVPVGEFVLRQSCNHLKTWLNRGYEPIKIAINISPRQFQDRTFAYRVKEIITESGLPPELIELEITESLLMDDADKTLETLLELRSFGLSLAIDDFGTGYSSLGYLTRFPVQYVKIDREFLKGLPEDYNNAAITSAVIAMAQNLSLSAIAEGVENVEQIAFLKSHGCHIGQGYFYGKPLPFEDLLERFKDSRLPADILEQLERLAHPDTTT